MALKIFALLVILILLAVVLLLPCPQGRGHEYRDRDRSRRVDAQWRPADNVADGAGRPARSSSVCARGSRTYELELVRLGNR